VPDEVTICKFRRLREAHNLGARLFELIGECLTDNGLKVSTGTIVDASIIDAPRSTGNREGKRDPEMHQTRKSHQSLFGMKAYVGVDSKSELIHSVLATAANVHDATVMEDLLHGEQTRVWGDSASIGQRDRLEQVAP